MAMMLCLFICVGSLTRAPAYKVTDDIAADSNTLQAEGCLAARRVDDSRKGGASLASAEPGDPSDEDEADNLEVGDERTPMSEEEQMSNKMAVLYTLWAVCKVPESAEKIYDMMEQAVGALEDPAGFMEEYALAYAQQYAEDKAEEVAMEQQITVWGRPLKIRKIVDTTATAVTAIKWATFVWVTIDIACGGWASIGWAVASWVATKAMTPENMCAAVDMLYEHQQCAVPDKGQAKLFGQIKAECFPNKAVLRDFVDEALKHIEASPAGLAEDAEGLQSVATGLRDARPVAFITAVILKETHPDLKPGDSFCTAAELVEKYEEQCGSGGSRQTFLRECFPGQAA